MNTQSGIAACPHPWMLCCSKNGSLLCAQEHHSCTSSTTFCLMLHPVHMLHGHTETWRTATAPRGAHTSDVNIRHWTTLSNVVRAFNNLPCLPRLWPWDISKKCVPDHTVTSHFKSSEAPAPSCVDIVAELN